MSKANTPSGKLVGRVVPGGGGPKTGRSEVGEVEGAGRDEG